MPQLFKLYRHLFHSRRQFFTLVLLHPENRSAFRAASTFAARMPGRDRGEHQDVVHEGDVEEAGPLENTVEVEQKGTPEHGLTGQPSEIPRLAVP